MGCLTYARLWPLLGNFYVDKIWIDEHPIEGLGASTLADVGWTAFFSSEDPELETLARPHASSQGPVPFALQLLGSGVRLYGDAVLGNVQRAIDRIHVTASGTELRLTKSA
jgi:hypothetical protein